MMSSATPSPPRPEQAEIEVRPVRPEEIAPVCRNESDGAGPEPAVKPDIRTVPAVRFTNLVRDDNGNLFVPPVWEETDKIDNAPPGYSNVCRVLNAVLYEGKHYSVYIASKSLPFAKNNSTEAAGQFRCIWGQRKVIMWLEDSEGKLFKSPALSIGNSSAQPVGANLTHFVDDLEPDTEYAYSFRFKDGDGTLFVYKTIIHDIWDLLLKNATFDILTRTVAHKIRCVILVIIGIKPSN